MNFSKMLEKFDRVLTGRWSVFDMRSPFVKTGVTSDFFKYFWKRGTSYTVIKMTFLVTKSVSITEVLIKSRMEKR